MIISVIVCTFNRFESLKHTLDSVCKQNISDFENYEVIVIDNNSSDLTYRTVENFKKKYPNQIGYFLESRQGLSLARNRGIKESKGEILVFTDDDCIAENNWLNKIASRFNLDPETDIILGGAIWEDGKRMYNKKNILRGNGLNMAIKKSVFETLGLFDINFGAGSICCSADDTEFIYRAFKKQKKIIICDEIQIIHKRRLIHEDGIKLYYRDCKGYILFLLKYVIKDFDKFAVKRILCFFSEGIIELFNGLLKFDLKIIKASLIKLCGILAGFTKFLLNPKLRSIKGERI